MSGGAAIAALGDAFESAADPARAPQMAAYMKDHFAFFGISAADRRALAKGFVASFRSASPEELLDAAEVLWDFDEREFQYTATDLLRRWAGALEARHLDRVRGLVVDKAWWDTVDALAAHVVGPMVAAAPELSAAMDVWIHDDDMWVARTAILHQLTYKAATDADRLFRYVAVRAGDKEFFIRKALGWALRQYARTAPDEVRSFVDAHRHQLSGLTIREATKHL